MKDIHTILNEIIDAAKECGQILIQADRNNFGIKDKAGKANFVTASDCKVQKIVPPFPMLQHISQAPRSHFV